MCFVRVMELHLKRTNKSRVVSLYLSESYRCRVCLCETCTSESSLQAVSRETHGGESEGEDGHGRNGSAATVGNWKKRSFPD